MSGFLNRRETLWTALTAWIIALFLRLVSPGGGGLYQVVTVSLFGGLTLVLVVIAVVRVRASRQ